MTNYIFNENGVANVSSFSPSIQAQYKGSGRGCVVISTDGEVVALRYNGVIKKDKVAEFEATIKAYKEAGHAFFSCHFSSGQVLLDRSDIRKTLLERYSEWENYTDVICFGIPVEFFVNKNEVFERNPCSNGGYNYPDGLHFSNDCPGGRFELVVTVSE